MTAWTLSGISTSSIPRRARHRPSSQTSRPSSIRWRTISSRKNGLPSERSRIRRRTPSGSSSTSEQERDEPRALLAAQRVERQRAEAPPPSAPVGTRAEQVGTRGAEEEDRPVEPLGELVEDVEHRRVGPVEVLDDGDDRGAPCHRGEQRAPRGDAARGRARAGRAMPSGSSGGRRPSVEARAAAVRDGRRRAPASMLVSTSRAIFADGCVGRIGVEHDRFRLQHLGERPERDALPVRQAAPDRAPSPRPRAARGTRARAGSCRRRRRRPA